MNLINKKTGFAIATALCALVVALLCGEIAVRLLYPGLLAESTNVSDSVIRPDPHLGFVLAPNSLGQDAWGFKNFSVPNTVDIVALGDSHTYGIFGTHEDWPTYLAKDTGETIYNMGVWGYGPAEYNALLPKAFSLKPETIIVGLFVENDIFNAYDSVYHHEGWKSYKNPAFADVTPITDNSLKQTHVAFQDIRDYLRAHFALYTLLGNSTRNLREYLGFSSPRTIGTHDWSTKDPDASLIYDAGKGARTLFWVGSRIRGVDTSKTEIQEGLSLTERFMMEMGRQAETRNSRIIFALIPSKESVYAPLVDASGLSNDVFESIVKGESDIRASLLETCARAKLSCFDMLPVLVERVQKGEHLYTDTWDDHPLPAGYAVYADAIASYLKTL